MSAAQRAVMNYAGYKDAMDSIAKINQYAQEVNNKYGQAFAQMAAQLGDEQAKRDQQSAQFDYEAYNQAHGARRLMASQRRADAMNYLNNWAKGLVDLHMWRDQMGLYQEDLDERKKDGAYRRGENKTIAKNKVQLDPSNLFANANFANNPYAGTPWYLTRTPEFTAITPQDKIKKMKKQSIPKSWSSTNNDYMKITGVNKLPTWNVPLVNYINSLINK